MVWVLMGVRGCVLWPTGHSLVTLFLCLSRLRTGRCIGFQSGHRLIILNTYFLMGAGRLVTLLSWVPALSRLTDWRRGWWTCKHRTKSGTQEQGLESKFGWGPRPRDRRVAGWSCLCLRYKRGVCSQGTQLGALIRESPDNPVWLVLGLAPQ